MLQHPNPSEHLQPGRNWNSDQYRFGFQGQEADNEIKGDGNSINYKYRVHDPRLGRFLSIDPLAPKYPHNSPYAFSENRVIDGVELEGLEWECKNKQNNTVFTAKIKIQNDANISKHEISRNIRSFKAGARQFNRENKDLGYKIKLRFDTKSDVNLTDDFYVNFKEEVLIEGVPIAGMAREIGNTESNEIQIGIGFSKETYEQLILHELGHTAGLHHPDFAKSIDSYEMPVDDKNFMWQGYKGLNASESQFNTMKNTIENGYVEPPFKTNYIEPIKTKEIKIEYELPDKLEKR